MATEHIVDLEHQRYADRPYEGEISPSCAAEEQAQAAGRQDALSYLRNRVNGAAGGPFYLTTADLASLLTVLGLHE
jgi:hypothetical protein